ncbi:MAG: adenylosuccinate lyase [Bdellovibrionales bacterium RIFOXYB1_FULL_37_110]|nr:MAG: adenylosuccinate lyase [Bdellovibrionales bacterium RIFOXYA1_FULL_38_20]OFZ51099.1 MAG: adenylosuccinate lyase [Bdellovibrionales bacterium RIFOXYC1_FULL_37_79]OFZ60311.1 MAG: adenylosuccinate lyase [Bdellovibrionales bacterium RIFOXYB1_FULL_37_110]OFZ63306.1 MAG: adenylosuccinate lyase [Bdellovibrionales bacterium RIFOXYD1_FULL_36_51]
MIPRYQKEEISQIWSEENKFNTYLKTEIALLKSLEQHKVIQAGIAQKIEDHAIININRINEIEQTTQHDIIAFCSSITEKLDSEVGKYFHFGVTSSDIIDSSTMLQIKESMEQIISSLKKVLTTLIKKVDESKNIITIGRSHGMFAEPMSFAQKWLSFYAELSRHLKDYEQTYQNDLTVQFSGAVGNFTILSPEIEKTAADFLHMKVEPVSTQIIPRDRIAKIINLGGLIGCAIERLAVEIRHLHRSDVSELHEGFKKGQKGSSTMPHKKNPISAENLTGMSRILRSHMDIASENIILWHERDISHSCAERMYLPDHFGILFYSLERLNSTLENLVLHVDVIENKVKEEFTYLSSYFLHYLILNTNLKRDDLYAIVQAAAFKAHESKSKEIFEQTLLEELKKKNIKVDLPKIDYNFIRNIYLKSFDEISKRVFKEYPL